jgi:exonuclease III
VGNCNTSLPTIGRSSRQKTNTEILELNDTIELMELTNVYRVFHPATTQYTFFSADRGTFSKTDHIVAHKASLNKYKKMEITSCMLSDNNAIKLEHNNKSSSRKYSTMNRLRKNIGKQFHIQ